MPFFFAGHDRGQGMKDLDRGMIAEHNINGGFTPPKNGWMLDSGGYGQIVSSGRYEKTTREYVQFVKWCGDQVGKLVCAFQQDYPANEKVAEAIGTDVRGRVEHALCYESVERYHETRKVMEEEGCRYWVAPVLQGRSIRDYLTNLLMVSGMVPKGAIVGIGNLKVKEHDPVFLRDLIMQIRRKGGEDLRLHALGIGKQFVLDSTVGHTLRKELWSFDSSSWKLEAFYNGRDNHDVKNARRYQESFEEDAPLFW
jgi:hypothetical protein